PAAASSAERFHFLSLQKHKKIGRRVKRRLPKKVQSPTTSYGGIIRIRYKGRRRFLPLSLSTLAPPVVLFGCYYSPLRGLRQWISTKKVPVTLCRTAPARTAPPGPASPRRRCRCPARCRGRRGRGSGCGGQSPGPAGRCQ